MMSILSMKDTGNEKKKLTYRPVSSTPVKTVSFILLTGPIRCIKTGEDATATFYTCHDKRVYTVSKAYDRHANGLAFCNGRGLNYAVFDTELALDDVKFVAGKCSRYYF